MSPERSLCRAWDRLAEASDTNRGARLMIAAMELESLVELGHSDCPASDALAAQVLHLLVDVDRAAGWDHRRLTGTALEPSLGGVLDRMAAEPDIHRRAALLEELCALIPDDDAAEVIACLPYAPGMVGWRHEEYMPREVSLRGFAKALGVAWRSRRAA